MHKISLQMYTMRDHIKTIQELDKTLGKLHDIGFDMLQYSIPNTFDAKEVKKLFDSHSIINDSVFCSAMELEERAKDIMAQCELFGTNYVRISSIERGLTNTASGYKLFAQYLNDMAQYYKGSNTKILYHFHAFEFRRFGNKTGLEILLAETNPEFVQIIPDTHWIHSGGKSIVDFLKNHKDRFHYIHVKDFAIGNMGDKWEARPIEFAPVGEGNLDWEPIIRFAKENNVASYAIEQDDCYGRDPFECVKSSYDYLKKIGVDD